MLTYAELLERTDGPPGSSWGLFGPDDERGTLNFLTAERVRAAAALVHRGAVFGLDCSIDAFDPPVASHRHTPRHVMFQNNPNHRDDYLDGFYLQATTHIDGLRHMRHPVHGFYNGAPDDGIAVGNPRLGINRWAETGIVGRGVLVDIERYLGRRGQQLDYGAGEAFGVDVVRGAAGEQGIEFQPGDILLLRTGWLRFYFERMTSDERASLADDLRCPGLLQSHATLAWLWDNQFALAAADNVALEAYPAVDSSPFATKEKKRAGDDSVHAGLMHQSMIALLGLAVGELWALDELAEDCARDGSYEFLVMAKPLNLVGGVGSPANALAIK